MKIVHIGDSDSGGGAAHAMSRLHGALQRLGADSHVLVRNSPAPGNAVETLATRGDADDLFAAVREAVVRQYVELNRTSISNTHFSLHIDGADVSRVPLVASSDIVHLHWTASVLTPADIRALFDAKPVVWTLHDLEPLTGGCHFPAGCEGYSDDCRACPQLVRDPFQITATTLRDKKTLWAGAQPTFVAPSRYMAERARSSAVAQSADASIVHIPHGIDVEVFRPQPKAAARRALGLPVDGLYVLCGSSHNAEKRKGLGLLNRVLVAAAGGSQPSPLELTLLTVGEPKLEFHDLNGTRVMQLGRIGQDAMPAVYAAADVFLHPAVEDNFPCMLLESMSCGTPAIAFDIGGVPDIVQDDVSGRLAAVGDELAMAAALSSLVRDRQRLQRLSQSARKHIERHFSDVSMARLHADLYDDVAKNRAASRTPEGRPRRAGIEEIFPRWATACVMQEAALARERAAELADESRTKSEHIAALEREAAGLDRSLADQRRQVQEKEVELIAIRQVADERNALAENLHAAAASIEARAAKLLAEVRERDDLLARREALIDEQRTEIEQIRRVAADRRLQLKEKGAELREREDLLAKLDLIVDEQGAEIELIHRVAADRRLQLQEKELELTAVHEVADERQALAGTLHAAAAKLQAELRERGDTLAKLGLIIGEQGAEIELIHRVAADRRLQLQEKELELTAVHEVADERKVLAEKLHASVASGAAIAAELLTEVRARDDLLAKLNAMVAAQGTEIELIHRVAADRRLLIEDLHRMGEKRAAVIARLSELADQWP